MQEGNEMEIRMNANNTVVGMNLAKREAGIGLFSRIRETVAKLAALHCERQRIASAAADPSEAPDRKDLVAAPIVHEMCVC